METEEVNARGDSCLNNSAIFGIRSTTRAALTKSPVSIQTTCRQRWPRSDCYSIRRIGICSKRSNFFLNPCQLFKRPHESSVDPNSQQRGHIHLSQTYAQLIQFLPTNVLASHPGSFGRSSRYWICGIPNSVSFDFFEVPDYRFDDSAPLKMITKRSKCSNALVSPSLAPLWSCTAGHLPSGVLLEFFRAYGASVIFETSSKHLLLTTSLFFICVRSTSDC